MKLNTLSALWLLIGLILAIVPVIKLVNDFWEYTSEFVLVGGYFWVIGIVMIIIAYILKE